MPELMPQWKAVMKYGVRSVRVLLTMKPVQNVEPPSEMTPTDGMSRRQSNQVKLSRFSVSKPLSNALVAPKMV